MDARLIMAVMQSGMNDDDDVPSIDISFDGTWHKRGFTSHYGVGVAIDVLTGYVTDFEVLSTYCHTCAINSTKLEQMTDAERQEWEQQHRPNCCINYEGSSKSMEKEAALRLWGRSEERHGLRYRTMLSDGDSVAYNAVHQAAPYGPQKKVTKLECVNHVHKRFGTALHKAAKEGRLGGHGQAKLTADKCTRLQNYFRGAVLDNLDSEDNMCQAIWATLLHCISTDEEPHHTRCPPGEKSWCFFKRALALGEQPGPHAERCGTALSKDVANALVPQYRRFSSPALLKRVLHGKTQNANESLNDLIWVHCPKTVFVGSQRLTAAVSQAVSKYNRGNFHLAEVMENLNISATQVTLVMLDKEDKKRVKKANVATNTAFIARRRARHVDRQHALAQQEDEEGATYGAGMLQEP